jgi:hypothetical protein
MVSCAVLTEVPADALECPLAASELMARLRAESAAMAAALVALLEVLLELLELAEPPPDDVPPPPDPAPAKAKGVAAGVEGEPLIVVDVPALLAAEANAAAAVDRIPTVGVAEGGGGWVGVAVPPAVAVGPVPAAVVAGFDEPPPPELEPAALAAVVTVPATALVDCVPLGVPAEVLT